MTDITTAETFALGNLTVSRLGYGVMHVAGPDVFGAPKDHDGAIAVPRAAGAQVSTLSTRAISPLLKSPIA
ncbi:hypothetical protein [Sphingomonas faeni]|uniref:hypothetical protein n=1 Tax=Sphingomonas faeni TaxID=185950 RepID=UPI0033598B75